MYRISGIFIPSILLILSKKLFHEGDCSPLTDLPVHFGRTAWHNLCVTQKEIVLDAISELPDEVSLREIAERIEFLAAIQKGMDQLDRGEGIPHEEIKRQLATWLASWFGLRLLATTCATLFALSRFC
jgi:predicted transcriptional regulator